MTAHQFQNGFFPDAIKRSMEPDAILLRCDTGTVGDRTMVYDVVELDTFARFPAASVDRFFQDNRVLFLEAENEAVVFVPAKPTPEFGTSPFLAFVGEHIASGDLSRDTRAVAGPEFAALDGDRSHAPPVALMMIDNGELSVMQPEEARARIEETRNRRLESGSAPEYPSA